jgi:tRNA threonylcarbamoyl adenosine modification protein YeaZ
LGGPLLGIDCSTGVGTLCLVAPDRGLVVERQLPSRCLPSDHLVAAIAEASEAAQVDLLDLRALCVGHGPGSFTGLRVGLATAHGLSLASGCQLLGVSSLQIQAYSVARQLAPSEACEVLVLLDARQEEAYAGLYALEVGQRRLQVELADCRLKRSTLAAALAKASPSASAVGHRWVTGDLAAAAPPGWQPIDLPPMARAALFLGLPSWRADAELGVVLPQYLRQCAAEERLHSTK